MKRYAMALVAVAVIASMLTACGGQATPERIVETVVVVETVEVEKMVEGETVTVVETVEVVQTVEVEKEVVKEVVVTPTPEPEPEQRRPVGNIHQPERPRLAPLFAPRIF